MCKGVLDVSKGSVDLEHVSNVLCTLGPELIVVKTANEGRIGVSAAADSRNMGKLCLLERLEGLVRLERLSERLRTLWTDAVVDKTANSAKSRCQRLLTVEKRACGGALELLERRVGLEGLREVLCALSTDAVVPETASDGEIRVSAAPDSRESGVRRRTRACGASSWS